MNDYILFKYLHFLALFIMAGSVFAQQFLIKKEMGLKEIKQIAITDAIYGISAISVAMIGLTLWFWVGKGADFYTKNWIFHTKVGLFIVVALLSIYPTVFYLRERKKLKEGEAVTVPKKLIYVVRLEMIFILLIPLLAVLMANGIGYYG